MHTTDKGHGRIETRELWASGELNEYVDFPHVGQVLVLRRTVLRRRAAVPTVELCVGITSLTAEEAPPARLLALSRGHWSIENGLHWVRDVTFDEDRSQVRMGHAPQMLATLRNIVIGVLRLAGATNIAAALRHLGRSTGKVLRLLGLRATAPP